MACGQGDAPHEHLGSTTENVQGAGTGHDDVDPFDANVVVKIGDGSFPAGTGTLISPRIVLTAAHVIYGSDSPGHEPKTPCVPTLTPPVFVGENSSIAAAHPRKTVDRAGILTGCVHEGFDVINPEAEAGLDFILLFLDPNEPFIENANIVRPSLDPNVGGPVGAAGWSAYSDSASDAPADPDHQQYRYAGIFNNLDLTFHEGHPNHNDAPGTPPAGHIVVRKPTDNLATASGDSGGPLFHVRPDGTRDTFGVYAELGICLDFDHAGLCTYWTDVSRGANRQFILDHAQDNSHADGWYPFHGKVRGDYWYGEADYVGPCQRDKDGDCDHWYDDHDNCPLKVNYDQKDSNGDNIGDACTCPCDPGDDVDGDSICGPSCKQGERGCAARCAEPTPLAKVDNCPRVWNFDQANCNKFSEITLNHALQGDACDPVPCPLSSADAVTNGPDSCKGDNRVGFFCEGRRVRNVVQTTTVGSQSQDRQCLRPDCGLDQGHVVPFVPTQMRFCQLGVDPSGRSVNCRSAPHVRNLQAAHFPSSQDELVDANFPWHRVSVDGLTPANRNGSFFWNYGAAASDPTQSSTPRAWDYSGDASYWLSAGKIPAYATLDATYLAQCQAKGGLFNLDGTCLNGTFWVHADTEVGGTVASFRDPGGTVQVVGLHDEDLSNHFFDLQPDEVYSYQRRGTGFLPDKPFFIWESLPDPYWSERIRRAGVVLPGPQDATASVYSLQQDGTAVDISPTLSDDVRQLLHADNVQVVSAAEPSTAFGKLEGELLGAFVRRDGALAAPFTAKGVVAKRGGGTIGVGRQASVASTTMSTTIPPRTNPVAVFSRAAGGLFVLGGQDDSGAPLHDLWFQPLQGDFSRVDLGNFALGDVRAATYTFSDHRLWVLDEALDTHTLRLLRIDPTNGSVETLAGWAHPSRHCRRASSARYSLVVGSKGTPLLTISRGDQSTVLELKVGKRGLRASAMETVQGRLSGAPVVDMVGLSYVIKQRDGSFRVERRRAPRPRFDDDSDRDDHKWIGGQVDPQ
jgi:hypothetical protein